MKKLVIIGASGHGKVVADIASNNGYDNIIFLDDNIHINECAGHPVIGKSTEIDNIEADVIVAIGNTLIRKQIQESIDESKLVTLIHPKAVVSQDVVIGKGSVVMAGAVINASARIGKGCIINTCASVDHDCVVNDYSHISVGSHLCGTVNIGSQTWVGAGVIVSNNVNICDKCTIGAGAVVVRNIENPGTYVGVPVRKIK